MVVVAFYVDSLAFDMSFHTFWTSVVDFVILKDVLVGVLKGVIYAPVLVIMAPSAFRFVFAKPRRLRVKIAAAFLALMTINTLPGYIWRFVLVTFILGPTVESTGPTPEPD